MSYRNDDKTLHLKLGLAELSSIVPINYYVMLYMLYYMLSYSLYFQHKNGTLNSAGQPATFYLVTTQCLYSDYSVSFLCQNVYQLVFVWTRPLRSRQLLSLIINLGILTHSGANVLLIDSKGLTYYTSSLSLPLPMMNRICLFAYHLKKRQFV